MPGYSQSVAWSPEDKMYVATCPELNNLMALADTEENAVQELKVAIELVLEDMLDSGEDIPEPQTYSLHSGQFRVRIPRTLHSRLALQAQRERVSLNSLVNMFLAEASSQLTASGFISERLKASYLADPVSASADSWKPGAPVNGNVLLMSDYASSKRSASQMKISDFKWEDRHAVDITGELG